MDPNISTTCTTTDTNSSAIPSTFDETTTTTTQSPTSSSTTPKGIAGRINYAQWDKVTKDLVTQIDEENQQETIEEQKKVRFRSYRHNVFVCVCFPVPWFMTLFCHVHLFL